MDLLLAALAQVLAHWTGTRTNLIDLEGHGREPLFPDIELSRTVGWFTIVYPAVLEVPSVAREGDVIKSIKEQLAAMPRRGIGYGLLRYLGNETTRNALRSCWQAEVAFNYFGQIDAGLAGDSLLRPVMRSVPAQRSPRQLRSHLIEINAMVRGQCLEVTWTFGRDIHRQATIQSLADQYIAALRSLIAHCRAVGEASYTPSDFPLAGMDQKQLDRLLGDLRQKKSRRAPS
jgi:non-ribosomal peptide synthase protein (TIGR01720 family)